MESDASKKRLEISREIDAIWCSREAARFAADAGFSSNEIWEVAISVSELTTNVLKFARTGTITLCRVESPHPGIELIVEDQGPGIDDIETAVMDGYSEGRFLTDDRWIRARNGLGTGLGAVRRLMDRVEIENKPEGGVRVTASKWLDG
jgi:serine/threonine-protein kinase RsbT